MLDSIYIEASTFKIDLHFKHLITVAIGYSSTGKTFLVSKIKELQSVNASIIKNSNIDIGDIFVIDSKIARDMLIEKQSLYKNKLVIIDRYDFIQNEYLDKLILRGNIQFLIMSHTGYINHKLHSESFITITYNPITKTFESDEIINRLAEDII